MSLMELTGSCHGGEGLHDFILSTFSGEKSLICKNKGLFWSWTFSCAGDICQCHEPSICEEIYKAMEHLLLRNLEIDDKLEVRQNWVCNRLGTVVAGNRDQPLKRIAEQGAVAKDWRYVATGPSWWFVAKKWSRSMRRKIKNHLIIEVCRPYSTMLFRLWFGMNLFVYLGENEKDWKYFETGNGCDSLL